MKNRLLRIALDALEIPQTAPGATTSHHKARGGSIARVNAGVLTELVSPPILECPHCHKPIPQPRTRRRRLWQVVAGGRVLSVEIEA